MTAMPILRIPYTGTAVGTDIIQARMINSQGNLVTSNSVEKRWISSNLPPIANAGPDKETCAGQPVTIGGTPTASGGNGGPYTILWSPATGLNSTTAPNPTASPTVTTTYTVTVTEPATGLSATDMVTVTVNPLPIAKAGADIAICVGQIVTHGGNPTGSGGTGALTFSWTPTTGLENPMAANPKARPIVKTTYTVTVTDAKGCQATDQVTVTVHDAVLLAEEYIHFHGPRASEGNLHSNGTINFHKGRPSVLTGNLFAVDEILIRPENTINGNAIAGNRVSLHGNAKVTGAVNQTPVPEIPLPAPSFTVSGKAITIGQKKSRTLPPGSYGDVKVLKGGKLSLTSGKYFMGKLEMNDSTRLTLDVTTGPITVKVVDNFKFGAKAKVVITPAGSMASAQVGFITLTKATIEIGAQSSVQGAIIAPYAMVVLQQNSRFKGSICAGKIDVHNGARFFHHSSTLSKADEPDEEEVEEEVTEEEVTGDQSPVASYQLEQNYPNPFSQIPRFAGNPSTMISFALPEAGKVTVNIFNETGQLVRRLIDHEMPGGRQTVHWNGRDQFDQTVAAGVYLYRLVVTGKTGEAVFTETKRMTFLK